MPNQLCCKSPTKNIFVWDSPYIGYAYNLYGCEFCGSIFKQDVWANKGTVQINVKNELTKVEEQTSG